MEKKDILKQQDLKESPAVVSFLHGLESFAGGAKHQYLQKNFLKCNCRSMEVSKWKLTRRNCLLRSLIRNWFRPSLAAQDSLSGCLSIQEKELNQNVPDIVVGSSWGGAIGLLLVSEGIWKGPIVLIASALKYILDYVGQTSKYNWTDIVSKINKNGLGKNILLIHGTKDKVIPYSTALDMVKDIEGLRLISVEGGNHSLNNFLIEKDNLNSLIREHYNRYSNVSFETQNDIKLQ